MSNLLRHFGLSSLGSYEAPISQQYRSLLSDTVTSDGWAVLAGSPGSGKTHLLGQVERMHPDVDFVHVLDLTDRDIRIASILQAIVKELSDENPKRHTSSLSHQVVSILGQRAVGGKKTCLVVDDAQRLPAPTLSAIKMLRERKFAGRGPLVSVILSGWPELAETIRRRKDILWRVELMPLTADEGWMTQTERERFLADVYGDALTEDARLTIAASCSVPEEMKAFVAEKMRSAYRMGMTQIDADFVAPSPMVLFQRLKSEHGEEQVSISTIARASGLGTTTVHRALHNPGDKHVSQVLDALKALSRELAATPSLSRVA